MPRRGPLKAVSISLTGSDMRKNIASILSSCDLPTTYVDNIAVEQFSASHTQPPFRPGHVEFRSTHSQQFYQTINKAKEALMLRSWLESNITSARQKLQACEPVRADLVRLQRALCKSLELKDVHWDCGWNVTHFRGCLLSFQALAQQHPETMDILKGRTLVFGNNTGISLDGYVLLNSGEVRHNWLDFIKNLWKDDAVLLTVPAFEKAASRVLRDIQIVRRKFQPQTMAKQYENNLRRLTTSMSDLQGRLGYPNSWPESLQDYELVVETEAGPLMLSPTGQFIVPASCPSFLLVNFITDNLQQAAQLLQTYKRNKLVEDELHGKCMTKLGLVALQKDDSITPNLMIPCCQQLLVHSEQLGQYLNNTRLFITTYYSVMSDGQICIPWNFKL